MSSAVNDAQKLDLSGFPIMVISPALFVNKWALVLLHVVRNFY